MPHERALGRVPPLVAAAVVLSALAGGISSVTVIRSGQAPMGYTSKAIQSMALAALAVLQTRPTWRGRNEPFESFALLSVAAGAFAAVTTLFAFAVGAALTWSGWAISALPSVQQAAQTWCAILATAAAINWRRLRAVT